MLIQPYKKSWAGNFNEIRGVIEDALSSLAVSVEHIGSTAVPGLAAKSIIDIDMVFDKAESFPEISRRLAAIGYYHNGNQGIPGREVFKRNPAAARHKVLDTIAHHLYACPTHGSELQKHILFRDWLLANADARAAYENLKYQIAEEAGQDKKLYAALKEIKAAAFINGIIDKAKAAL
jgi:GrpB-like predicted nucleotidyltransferase (UPF0157 family)